MPPASVQRKPSYPLAELLRPTMVDPSNETSLALPSSIPPGRSPRETSPCGVERNASETPAALLLLPTITCPLPETASGLADVSAGQKADSLDAGAGRPDESLISADAAGVIAQADDGLTVSGNAQRQGVVRPAGQVAQVGGSAGVQSKGAVLKVGGELLVADKCRCRSARHRERGEDESGLVSQGRKPGGGGPADSEGCGRRGIGSPRATEPSGETPSKVLEGKFAPGRAPML